MHPTAPSTIHNNNAQPLPPLCRELFGRYVTGAPGWTVRGYVPVIGAVGRGSIDFRSGTCTAVLWLISPRRL
jgi:hypothetical protein